MLFGNNILRVLYFLSWSFYYLLRTFRKVIMYAAVVNEDYIGIVGFCCSWRLCSIGIAFDNGTLHIIGSFLSCKKDFFCIRKIIRNWEEINICIFWIKVLCIYTFTKKEDIVSSKENCSVSYLTLKDHCIVHLQISIKPSSIGNRYHPSPLRTAVTSILIKRSRMLRPREDKRTKWYTLFTSSWLIRKIKNIAGTPW